MLFKNNILFFIRLKILLFCLSGTKEPVKKIFEKPSYHFLFLVIASFLTYYLYQRDSFFAGSFLGISTRKWFLLSMIIPVVHQVYVWFFWRIQLHYSLVTRLLGRSGFILYSIGFMLLFIVRFPLIFFLAVSSRNTLPCCQTIFQIMSDKIEKCTLF